MKKTSKKSQKNIFQYINDIKKAANRETNLAWFNGKPGIDKMLYHEEQRKVIQNFGFTIIKKVNSFSYYVLSRNKFSLSDTFEILSPLLNEIKKIKIVQMFDKDNISVTVVNTPMSVVKVIFDTHIELKKNDIVRIVR
ncbi:MAG: U32 family peptidase C-terminal domain-containing protein [Mycoplasmataceae bacterium]|nr:U32 family peptidase C-terminal domain-containing protein [Mycoplasmataceae bacterium]